MQSNKNKKLYNSIFAQGQLQAYVILYMYAFLPMDTGHVINHLNC